jgi:hypothetical protein
MPLAQAMRDLKSNSSRMLGDMGKRQPFAATGRRRLHRQPTGAPPEVGFRAGICGLVGQGGRRVRATIRVRMILVPSLQDSVLSHVYPALKRWAKIFRAYRRWEAAIPSAKPTIQPIRRGSASGWRSPDTFPRVETLKQIQAA